MGVDSLGKQGHLKDFYSLKSALFLEEIVSKTSFETFLISPSWPKSDVSAIQSNFDSLKVLKVGYDLHLNAIPFTPSVNAKILF